MTVQLAVGARSSSRAGNDTDRTAWVALEAIGRGPLGMIPVREGRPVLPQEAFMCRLSPGGSMEA